MSSFEGLSAQPTVSQRYDHLVETGDVTRDSAQEKIVLELDMLLERIGQRRLARKSSALGWLFGKRKDAKEPITGLYIHGDVGRGKSMLMDLFFHLVPAKGKRRAHFNDFMADVHDRIAQHRQNFKEGLTKDADPMPPIAAALAKDAWVLCFDEFTVTDIADAMILSRLFSALFSEGVVLVATSNVAPDDLYKDGLNRGLFMPFIQNLKDHVKVLTLKADTDYRMEKIDRLPVYISPLGDEATVMMDEAWATVTDNKLPAASDIKVMGRTIIVPRSVGQAARFSFDDLCKAALAARDYIAISAQYKTIFIDNVPVMDEAQRNEAKRFILLIDTLYEARTKVFISAEALPENLYIGKNGVESFEFARTASRLNEMQSREWVNGNHNTEPKTT